MAQAVASRDPYRTLIDELVALRKRERGWDSYDGEPASYPALLSAIHLVNSFQDLGTPPVPPPRAGLNADGSVILLWITVDRNVDIVFRDSGGEYSVVRRDTDEIAEEGPLDKIDPLKDVVAAHVLGWRPLERSPARH